MNKINTYHLSDNSTPIQEYFNFGLSVDCVVFGYQEGRVRVLLIERDVDPYKGIWALPGDLVPLDQDLLQSANSVLTRLTGIRNIFMEQFYTFGTVKRHPSGRVATVGYYSLVKSENHTPIASSWAKAIKWFDIDELPPLAFDHQRILDKGLRTLQRRVRYRPVGFELLPDKFTLKKLQTMYEALLGLEFDKPNFRKKILSMDLLVQLDEVEVNVSHRPAKLFKFDEVRYKNLRREGFNFDI